MNDGRNLIFVVGCQRSGTTWLQLLLYQHPAIASSQETHLFDRYIAKPEEAWRREQNPDYVGRSGLSRTLKAADFDRFLRAATDTVMEEILAKKKGAQFVVEKTPDHVIHADTILRLYPAATFIHIVRDPRSVVCSLRDGSYSWASDWASADPVVSARHWNRLVVAGRAIKGMTDRYLEVRYEDMLMGGAQKLGEIFAWLGIKAEQDFCVEAVAKCALTNLQQDRAGAATPWTEEVSPAAFYRKGQAEGWRDELSAADCRKVEYLTRALMSELGYDPVSRARKAPPVSLRLRLMRESVVNAALSLVTGPVSVGLIRRVLRKMDGAAEAKSRTRGENEARR